MGYVIPCTCAEPWNYGQPIKRWAAFILRDYPSHKQKTMMTSKLFQLCEFGGKSIRILLYLGPSSITRIILLVQKYDPHMFLIIITSVFREGVEGEGLALSRSVGMVRSLSRRPSNLILFKGLVSRFP